MNNEKPTLFEVFIERYPHMHTDAGQLAFKKGAAAMMGYLNDTRHLLIDGKLEEAVKKLEDAWAEYMRSV